MNFVKTLLQNWYKPLLKTSIAALLLVTLSLGLSGAWWNFGDNSGRDSRLPQGNAISDPTSILRYALPLDNVTIRKLQESIEDISEQLRGKRWSPINRDIKRASTILSLRSEEIIADVPQNKKEEARSSLEKIRNDLQTLREAANNKNKELTWSTRRAILNEISSIEEMMVGEFPFEIPEEYADLPRLKGRATIKITTEKGDLTVVVDGYNAPITAGNFVDLVQRDFYDGLKFIRAEEFYILQTGDPPGPKEGFVDPETGEYRSIPLEIKIRGEKDPIYGITLEEAGLYREQPVLPFSASGTVAMARPGVDPNGGSSQFFFFLFERELTPPGYNLLDGRYSVFGYTVEGQDVLENLEAGDEIISAKVIRGADNLVLPKQE